ncbi:hypothetical protein J6590_042933 [Homalodisca vitripennis]|nr:hypothetical protein J6590_042933 [Homalodisca vitripennis]
MRGSRYRLDYPIEMPFALYVEADHRKRYFAGSRDKDVIPLSIPSSEGLAQSQAGVRRDSSLSLHSFKFSLHGFLTLRSTVRNVGVGAPGRGYVGRLPSCPFPSPLLRSLPCLALPPPALPPPRGPKVNFCSIAYVNSRPTQAYPLSGIPIRKLLTKLWNFAGVDAKNKTILIINKIS